MGQQKNPPKNHEQSHISTLCRRTQAREILERGSISVGWQKDGIWKGATEPDTDLRCSPVGASLLRSLREVVDQTTRAECCQTPYYI